MSDDIRQVRPDDPEIGECWLRETGEPEISAVAADRVDDLGGWLVSVWVMEYVSAVPLEADLRERIARALRAVNGVTGVEENAREDWLVTGAPSGKALVEAAGQVVDELARRTRASLRRQQPPRQ